MVRIFALLLTVLLSACGASARPDLRRLYEFGTRPADQPPVIVIPGILGSTLRDPVSGEELWPRSLWNVALGSKESLTVPFDPQTLETREAAPEGLFESFLGTDYYGQILRTLEKSGGYHQATPGTPVNPDERHYYVFTYDWRQDNVRTAARLDAFIEQIRRDYGNPALKVDLVAHSMGGLIARYFLRYGARDVLDEVDRPDFRVPGTGATKVRTAILLGTPNLGTVDMLHGLIEGGEVGLQRIPSEVMATMPGGFEMLPHPVTDWLIDVHGAPVHEDLFDVAVWRRYHLCVFDEAVAARVRARFRDRREGDAYLDALRRLFAANLARGRRFIRALSVRYENIAVHVVVFGGDCTLTPARLVLEDDGGQPKVRLNPRDIAHPVPGVDYGRLMLEPGDGEVTKPSLLAREKLDPTAPPPRWAFFPLAYSFFLCEDHKHLTGNVSFQDNLLNVLLSRERPWDEPGLALPAAP